MSVLLISFFLIYFQNTIFAESGKLFTIDSIQNISRGHPKETIIFFDLDDTLIDYSTMVGSKEWRKYFSRETNQNYHDFFSLFLAKNFPVTTIEPQTNELVMEFQDYGYSVCGLTAREREIWFYTPTENVDILTINQLVSAGIHFNDETFQSSYPILAQDPEYFKGVFFANTDLKGEYLKRILLRIENQSDLPKKIIFIDDKLSQIESVASVLEEMEIDYECYWYTATEGKSKTFDPLIANIQLYFFWFSNGKELLTDYQAKEFALKNTENDHLFYLRALLKSAEERN